MHVKERVRRMEAPIVYLDIFVSSISRAVITFCTSDSEKLLRKAKMFFLLVCKDS